MEAERGQTERSRARLRRTTTQAENAGRAYRAALNRLVEGKATHPTLAGRPVRITPAAVAREARRSRNPLYTTHRSILDGIAVAAGAPSAGADLAATVARLRAGNSEPRAAARGREAPVGEREAVAAPRGAGGGGEAPGRVPHRGCTEPSIAVEPWAMGDRRR